MPSVHLLSQLLNIRGLRIDVYTLQQTANFIYFVYNKNEIIYCQIFDQRVRLIEMTEIPHRDTLLNSKESCTSMFNDFLSTGLDSDLWNQNFKVYNGPFPF